MATFEGAPELPLLNSFPCEESISAYVARVKCPITDRLARGFIAFYRFFGSTVGGLLLMILSFIVDGKELPGAVTEEELALGLFPNTGKRLAEEDTDEDLAPSSEVPRHKGNIHCGSEEKGKIKV